MDHACNADGSLPRRVGAREEDGKTAPHRLRTDHRTWRLEEKVHVYMQAQLSRRREAGSRWRRIVRCDLYWAKKESAER